MTKINEEKTGGYDRDKTIKALKEAVDNHAGIVIISDSGVACIAASTVDGEIQTSDSQVMAMAVAKLLTKPDFRELVIAAAAGGMREEMSEDMDTAISKIKNGGTEH
jgi:2-C-methyl-D-erythritol 4-phosphate cytidylyltransferase